VVAISPGLRLPWPEAYHLPLLSAEVNIVWNPTSISQDAFIQQCLIYHRGEFTVNLTIRNYLETLGEVSKIILKGLLRKLDTVLLTGLI